MKSSQSFDAIETLISQLSNNFPPLSFTLCWKTNENTAYLRLRPTDTFIPEAEFFFLTDAESCQIVLDCITESFLPW